MDFLRKLLKYLFLSKTEEPVHPDSTQEIIPAEPPVAPPDIDPAAEPIKEIAEQVVSTPTTLIRIRIRKKFLNHPL
jgi:hypothetical protein